MKVGIVSCGRIATAVHLPLLKKMSGVSVVAVDIDEDRLREVVERYHIDEEYVKRKFSHPARSLKNVFAALRTRLRMYSGSRLVSSRW